MSAGGFGLEGAVAVTPKSGATGLAELAERALARINGVISALAQLALVAACCILTSSVVLRYFLKIPTDWQDEASVFLLVGVTFLSGARVQAERGHVGIEALVGFLSPAANHWRHLFCDAASLAFCAFFAWKSWTLFAEALVNGSTTDSTWAPPLWIPYSLMAAGMTFLVVELLIQVVARLQRLADRS